ncbi:MAG: calcium/sodium antiporter [Methanobacterium sp.]
MLWIIALVTILIVSLIIVIKAADIFVDKIVEIGGIIGISEIILGVTASAIGTSLPEFGSAVMAALFNSPDLGVGVVIGSNIWNIAGILGISAIFAGTIRSSPKGITRDGAFTLLTAFILLGFMYFRGVVDIYASIIFVIVYSIYLWILIRDQKKEVEKNKADKQEKIVTPKGGDAIADHPPEEKKKIGFGMIAWSLVGLAGLIVGCRLLVYSGTELAIIANIPQMIMGLFTLAIGTSIPELVVTFNSARKGLHDLSIGTILGSNTFNIMIGLGIPAIFMSVPIEHLSYTFDAPVMIFVTVLVLLLIKRGMKLTRVDGFILALTYITYAVLRIYVLG